jgi:hypothetical protein
MQPITDVFRLFRYQRAIRSFTNEEVPDDWVNQVLTAAIHGPSGSNRGQREGTCDRTQQAK